MLKLNTFLAINAAVGIAFGLGFLLLPEPLLAFYGAKLDAAGLVIGRLAGAELIGANLVRWGIRSVDHPKARRLVVLSGMISEGLGFVVTLIAQLSGLFNIMGWSAVALYGIFALGFAYFYFIRKGD